MKKLIEKFSSFSIIKQFIVWRLWLFAPLVFGLLFFQFRSNSEFTTIWKYTEKYPVVESSLVYPWSNFDGVHYMGIASRGYINEGRFLPLFPALIRTVSQPVAMFTSMQSYGQLSFWSGFILSNGFFIASLYMLHKLMKLDFKEEVINKTIFLLLIFPTAFFFVSIYTESLFLFLSLSSLYFARKRKWFLASVVSMLLVVTRLPGILIVIPLLYEYFVSLKEAKGKKDYLSILFFLLIPLPLLGYAQYNYNMWGDFLYFVNAHATLGNSREVAGVVFPLVTVYRYLKIFLGISPKQYEFWVAVLEFLSFIFASVGIWLGYKKKIRISYLLFSVALISLPLLSGTLTGFPRYILVAFPIFVGFASWVDYKKISGKVFVLTSVLLQILFVALFTRGYFIA